MTVSARASPGPWSKRSATRIVACIATFYAARANAQPTARFDDVRHQQSETRSSAPRAEKTEGRPIAAERALRSADRHPDVRSWATQAAARLVAQGHAHERRRDPNLALRSYVDAIGMDSSYGLAYLALGRLREAMGDPNEAERTYDQAVKIGDVAAVALELRARLRHRQGRYDEALADLEAAIDRDPARTERLELLADWYVRRRAWPAALALWRRMLATHEARGNDRRTAAARVQVYALTLLAADTDPVASPGPATGATWVRRSMARLARTRP